MSMPDADPNGLSSVRNTDADLHAQWFLRPARRWPLGLVVFMGAGLSFLALVGQMNAALARSRSPVSNARRLALATSPVPDSENAAVLWREAASEIKTFGWKISDSTDFRNPATFEQGTPFVACVGSNQAAIETARKAAKLSACSWGLEYQRIYPGFANGSLEMPVARLGPILHFKAILSAHSNNWSEVIECLQTMRAAVRHSAVERTAFSISNLWYMDSYALTAIEKSLSAYGAEPDAATLQQLEQFIRARLREGSGVAEVLEGERAIGLAAMDLYAEETADDESLTRVNLLQYSNVPPTVDPYRVIYPFDRWHFQRMMDREISKIRSVESGHAVKQTMSSGNLDRYAYGPFFMSGHAAGLAEVFKDRAVMLVARWRMALIGVSALRYRLTHANWPADLAATGLERDVLLDPSDLRGNLFSMHGNKDGSLTLVSNAYKDYEILRRAEVITPVFNQLTFTIFPPVSTQPESEHPR